jgi:hypothetical protein
MLGEDAASAPEDVAADDAVCLFQIPTHLRAAWWDLLDAAAGSGGPLEGFGGFAARVVEFLAYKQLNPPAAPHLEAIVTAAGERSIRRDPTTGLASGLGPTVAPWTPWPPAEGIAVPRLWGVVNLGDEDTGVVLAGPPLAGAAAEVARLAADRPAPATVGELTGRWLRTFPDRPPLRVRLGPCEGCLLPADGLTLDGDPTEKVEPDVLLLISAADPGPSGADPGPPSPGSRA